MKVIDLLNKIANGEETHFNSKINGKSVVIHYYNDKNFSSATDPEMLTIADIIKSLNDEVEIIEEDKKIRKLDFIEENTFSKRQNGMTSEDRRLLDSNFRELGNKINEIIDYLEENK